MCRRLELIGRLKELQNGEIHEREIRRRGRLEGMLAELRPAVVANLTKVVSGDEATASLLSSTFRKLPANVALTPQSLRIEFAGTEEFLKAFGALVYALHNDFEEISRFLEQGRAGVSVRPKLVV
jgi:hypothetical protein